jgi:hypothetical protein
MRAPMTMPVQIGAADAPEGRWFRLSEELGPDGLTLADGLPELGVVALTFHVPGDPQPIACRARLDELVVSDDAGNERAERRELTFISLDDDARTRILRYLNDRLGL